MTRVKSSLAVFTFALPGLLSLGPVAHSKAQTATEKELKNLAGKWDMETLINQDVKATIGEDDRTRVVFDKGTFKMFVGGEERESGKVTLDVGKTPHQMTIGSKDDALRFIYKLENGVLTMTNTNDFKEFPKTFSGKDVYTRIFKKAAK